MPAIQVPQQTSPMMQTPDSVAHNGERIPGQTMESFLQQLSALQNAPTQAPPDVTPEMADAVMAHSGAINNVIGSTSPQPQVSEHEPLGSKIGRAAKALSSGYDLGAMSPEQRARVEELRAARSDSEERASQAEQHQRTSEDQSQQRLDLEKETAYHSRRLEDAQAEIRAKTADLDTQIKAYQLQNAKETDPIKRQQMQTNISHLQYMRDVYLPGELAAKQTEAQATMSRANILRKASQGATKGIVTDTTEMIPGTNTPISQKHEVKRPLKPGEAGGGDSSRPPLTSFDQQ